MREEEGIDWRVVVFMAWFYWGHEGSRWHLCFGRAKVDGFHNYGGEAWGNGKGGHCVYYGMFEYGCFSTFDHVFIMMK